MQTSRLAGKRICLLGPDEAATGSVAARLAGALRSLGHPVLVVDADPLGGGPYRALGLDTAPLDLLGLLVETSPATPHPVANPLESGPPMLGSTLDIEALPRTHIDCGPDGTWLVVLGKQRTLGAATGPATARFLRHLSVEGLGADGVVLVVHGNDAMAALDAPSPLDRRLLVVPPVLTDAAWLAIAEHMRSATEAANGCVLYDAGVTVSDPRLGDRLTLLDLPVLGRIEARGPSSGRVDPRALAVVRALEATEPGRTSASDAPARPVAAILTPANR